MESLGISRQPHLVSCYQQVYRFQLDPSGMEFKRMTLILFGICVCTVDIFRRRQKKEFSRGLYKGKSHHFCVIHSHISRCGGIRWTCGPIAWLW